VKRRVTVAATDNDGAVIMPAELTFQGLGGHNGRAFHQARQAWLLAHGIEDAHGPEAWRVLLASKRAHARIVNELDSMGRLLHRHLHGDLGASASVIRDAHGNIA